MMQSFLSSQEEHWAVKPIWHGGKSTQCGKRLGMETFVIYLFICTFFFLLHFHSDSLGITSYGEKRGAWRYFPLNSILQEKKKPKLGLYLVFFFWQTWFLTNWSWLFFQRHQYRLETDATPAEGHRFINPKGSHHTHKNAKGLLTHANVLCTNIWTEQSATTGKVPDRPPSIQQKHSFPAYIERRTPLSTPKRHGWSFPSFLFYWWASKAIC